MPLGDVDRAADVGDADDLHAAVAQEFHQRGADLAVALDDDALFTRESAEALEDRAGADRDAERRRAGVTERAADGERLAGDDAGRVVTAHHRHRVHDPTHDLGVGVDVRARGCRGPVR